MLNPTDQKRQNAADALYAAIEEARTHVKERCVNHQCLHAVDAITEYSIAVAIDHLTSIASSMIFRHSGPVPDEPQSGPSSDPE